MCLVFCVSIYSTIVFTHGYVLLTANIDEFKDFARKIVPGKLSDELTNAFIKKMMNFNFKDQKDDRAQFNLRARDTASREKPNIAKAVKKTLHESLRRHTIEGDRPNFSDRQNYNEDMRQDANFRENEYNGIDIEALAEKVSELLIRKYHINLEAPITTLKPKRKRVNYQTQMQEEEQQQFQRQSIEQQAAQPRPILKSPDAERFKRIETNQNLKTEFILNPAQFNEDVNRNIDVSRENIDDRREVAPPKTTTSKEYQPLKPYRTAEPELVRPRKQKHGLRMPQPVRTNKISENSPMYEASQPDFTTRQPRRPVTKKRFKKVHLLSEVNKISPTTKEAMAPAKTDNPDSQEYVEYVYYDDEPNGNEKAPKQHHPQKKLAVEFIDKPIGRQGSNDDQNKKPDDNFYLKDNTDQSYEHPFKEDTEPTETLLLGFLAKKTTTTVKPVQKANDMYQAVNLNAPKHDSYENYEIPKRDEKVFSSEEKPKRARDPRKHKSTTDAYEEYYEGHVSASDIRAATMTIGKWYDEDVATTPGNRNSFIISKYSIATSFNIRSRFTISTPNFLPPLPKGAEKYDFQEPLPDKDRKVEKLRYIGNPVESINNRHRLNKHRSG